MPGGSPSKGRVPFSEMRRGATLDPTPLEAGSLTGQHRENTPLRSGERRRKQKKGRREQGSQEGEVMGGLLAGVGTRVHP